MTHQAPKTPPAPAPQHWLPMPEPCPKCAQKLKALVAPRFSRMLEILCVKCGWRLNLEALRKALKVEHFDELKAHTHQEGGQGE